MGLLRRMFEGQGRLRAAIGRRRDEPAPCGAYPDSRPKVDRAVSERRAEAMRSFFPKLAIWINNRIHFSRMREVEAYLAQATDLVDLEHRIAKVERSASWH